MVELALILRAEPRSPTLAVARSRVALALIERLLRLDDAALRRLTGAWWPDGVIVQGVGDELPWVDGVEYLAAHPTSPGLYTPTTHDITPHPGLVLDALKKRHANHRRFAVLEGPRQLIPLTNLETLDRGRLVDAMVALRGGADP